VARRVGVHPRTVERWRDWFRRLPTDPTRLEHSPRAAGADPASFLAASGRPLLERLTLDEGVNELEHLLAVLGRQGLDRAQAVPQAGIGAAGRGLDRR
jgi:transposase-like protein